MLVNKPKVVGIVSFIAGITLSSLASVGKGAEIAEAKDKLALQTRSRV